MRETIQLYWTSIVELLAERLNIDRRKQCCTFRLKVVLTTVIICLVLFGAAGFAVLYKWDNCTGVANSGHKSPLFDSNDPDVKKIMAKGGPKVRKSDMPKTTTTTTTTNPFTNESRDLKPKTKPKLVIENLIPSTSSLPSSITRSPSSLVPHKDRMINVMGLDPTLPPPPPPNQGLLDQTPKRSTTIWSLIDQIRNNINQPTPCPPGHHLVVITTPDSASSNSNTRLARRQTSNDSPQSISLICKLFFGHTPPIPANDNDDIVNKLTSGAHDTIADKVDEVTTQSTPKSLKIGPKERVYVTPDPSAKRGSKGLHPVGIQSLPSTKEARTKNPFLKSLETTTPTPKMNIFEVQEFKPTTTTTPRPKRILTRRPTKFWPKPPTPTPRTTHQPTTTPAPSLHTSPTTKLKPQPPTKPPPNWKTVLKEILCKKICTANPSNGGLLCHCDGPPMYIYQMPSKPYFVVSDALGY